MVFHFPIAGSKSGKDNHCVICSIEDGVTSFSHSDRGWSVELNESNIPDRLKHNLDDIAEAREDLLFIKGSLGINNISTKVLAMKTGSFSAYTTYGRVFHVEIKVKGVEVFEEDGTKLEFDDIPGFLVDIIRALGFNILHSHIAIESTGRVSHFSSSAEYLSLNQVIHYVPFIDEFTGYPVLFILNTGRLHWVTSLSDMEEHNLEMKELLSGTMFQTMSIGRIYEICTYNEHIAYPLFNASTLGRFEEFIGKSLEHNSIPLYIFMQFWLNTAKEQVITLSTGDFNVTNMAENLSPVSSEFAQTLVFFNGTVDGYPIVNGNDFIYFHVEPEFREELQGNRSKQLFVNVSGYNLKTGSMLPCDYNVIYYIKKLGNVDKRCFDNGRWCKTAPIYIEPMDSTDIKRLLDTSERELILILRLEDWIDCGLLSELTGAIAYAILHGLKGFTINFTDTEVKGAGAYWTGDSKINKQISMFRQDSDTKFGLSDRPQRNTFTDGLALELLKQSGVLDYGLTEYEVQAEVVGDSPFSKPYWTEEVKGLSIVAHRRHYLLTYKEEDMNFTQVSDFLKQYVFPLCESSDLQDACLRAHMENTKQGGMRDDIVAKLENGERTFIIPETIGAKNQEMVLIEMNKLVHRLESVVSQL